MLSILLYIFYLSSLPMTSILVHNSNNKITSKISSNPYSFQHPTVVNILKVFKKYFSYATSGPVFSKRRSMLYILDSIATMQTTKIKICKKRHFVNYYRTIMLLTVAAAIRGATFWKYQFQFYRHYDKKLLCDNISTIKTTTFWK